MEIICEPNTDLTVVCFLIKFGRHVNPIDFGNVTVQRQRSQWVSLTNLGCAGMLRFALLYVRLL